MHRHLAKIGIVLGCLGLFLRFLLAAESIGSEDAQIWFEHGTAIAAKGVRYLYEHREASFMRYNHPPLMGYWSALAFSVSGGRLYEFSVWMKLPGLLGEVLSAALVYRIWLTRRPAMAALVFAAYGWSLPLILVSGYHCNTDCAYAGLTLLAVYLLQNRRRPFWSGVAMAGALNVKLMPLVLVPALLSQCRSRRELLSLGGGLALAVLPFVPFLITSAGAMYGNMIDYGSQQLDWGINAFLNYAGETPPFDGLAHKVRAPFLYWARYVILLAVAMLSALAALRRRPLGYEMGALAWALFLVLTSGYSVQYAVCVLPLLFAVEIRAATVYSLCAGILLLTVYTKNMVLTFPLKAVVQYYPFPSVGTLFGLLAWASLAAFVFNTVRGLCNARGFVAGPPAGTGVPAGLAPRLLSREP
jgi:Glycosyltransferase family 87